MTASLTRRRFVVSGRVQGVGFRWLARHWAGKLGLSGWARNREDGCVEAEVEGSAQAVAEFDRQLHLGPAGSHVDAVETVALRPEGGPPSFNIT